MRLRYFAWVRERIGKSEEELSLPPELVSVADLIMWLKAQGENYDYAFENAATIRASLDQAHVRHEALLAGADEIAFFPPMTGG